MKEVKKILSKDCYKEQNGTVKDTLLPARCPMRDNLAVVAIHTIFGYDTISKIGYETWFA